MSRKYLAEYQANLNSQLLKVFAYPSLNVLDPKRAEGLLHLMYMCFQEWLATGNLIKSYRSILMLLTKIKRTVKRRENTTRKLIATRCNKS